MRPLVSRAAAMGAAILLATASSATITSFSDIDSGATITSARPHADAAAAAFDAATKNLSLYMATQNFEEWAPSNDQDALLYDGVTVANGSRDPLYPEARPALYPFNTTAGGSFSYNYLGSGPGLTFTFDTPISAFGAYFTGLSAAIKLTFNDGTAQSFTLPKAATGGVFFFGFIDTSATISSITLAKTTDTYGIDDIRFSAPPPVIAPVPEPASWALMVGGFGLVGSALRRRRVAIAFA